MMKRELLFVCVILIFIVAMPAPQHGSQMDSSNRTVSPAWLTLQQSMENMHAEMMSVEPSRNSDVDFVRLMLPHHQAAIDMAKAELIHGKDPQMRRLAQEVITDQQSEIDLMRLWLKQHASLAANPDTR